MVKFLEYCDKTQNISCNSASDSPFLGQFHSRTIPFSDNSFLGQSLFQKSLLDNHSPRKYVTKCQMHRLTLGYLFHLQHGFFTCYCNCSLHLLNGLFTYNMVSSPTTWSLQLLHGIFTSYMFFFTCCMVYSPATYIHSLLVTTWYLNYLHLFLR